MNHHLYPPMFHSAFHNLYDTVMHWSAETFGGTDARGPLGPLRHLEKEAAEAQADCGDLTEYADCLIVLLDASWRAGFTAGDIIDAAFKKMEENRKREWPEVTDPNAPVEHVRK